jgi:NhaP-type Na+/H+ or K+/H+ antiporter
MFMKFIPLADIAAHDTATTYGWESVGLALLLALGLVGGLALTQVLYRWLIRHMTRSGSEPESEVDRSNGPQEC